MQRQIEMENSMLAAYRKFLTNLDNSLNMLDEDITEAAEMSQICTDEWCLSTEGVVDELAKVIYAISEPRWLTDEDSKRIRHLRNRIHDLYAKYKSMRK
jgi:hypothetical protein